MLFKQSPAPRLGSKVVARSRFVARERPLHTFEHTWLADGWQCEVQAGAAGSGNERKRDWPIEAGEQAHCLLRFDVAFLFKPDCVFLFLDSHSETT